MPFNVSTFTTKLELMAIFVGDIKIPPEKSLRFIFRNINLYFFLISLN